MAYRVKQFRYYNDESSYETEVQLPDNNGVLKPTKVSPKNQPSSITLSSSIITVTGAHYTNGDAFQNYFPVSQLGIQALPGTKFYLNGGTSPIIIGTTGIYELDLDSGIQITKITFDAQSIKDIANNENAFLLVDVMYDDGES